MKDFVSNGNVVTPMLFPYEPEQYWHQVRQIIREEVSNIEKQKPGSPNYETPGLTYKPLYKIASMRLVSCNQTYYLRLGEAWKTETI